MLSYCLQPQYQTLLEKDHSWRARHKAIAWRHQIRRVNAHLSTSYRNAGRYLARKKRQDNCKERDEVLPWGVSLELWHQRCHSRFRNLTLSDVVGPHTTLVIGLREEWRSSIWPRAQSSIDWTLIEVSCWTVAVLHRKKLPLRWGLIIWGRYKNGIAVWIRWSW